MENEKNFVDRIVLSISSFSNYGISHSLETSKVGDCVYNCCGLLYHIEIHG